VALIPRGRHGPWVDCSAECQNWFDCASCWLEEGEKLCCEPLTRGVTVQRADASVEEKSLRTTVNDDMLALASSETGKPMRLAVDIESRFLRSGPGNLLFWGQKSRSRNKPDLRDGLQACLTRSVERMPGYAYRPASDARRSRHESDQREILHVLLKRRNRRCRSDLHNMAVRQQTRCTQADNRIPGCRRALLRGLCANHGSLGDRSIPNRQDQEEALS
jgi:hypothetical protein